MPHKKRKPIELSLRYKYQCLLTRVFVSHDNVEDGAPIVAFALSHRAVDHCAPPTSHLITVLRLVFMKTVILMEMMNESAFKLMVMDIWS